jgi:2-C-methyl-D-erythritol 4-phosphate cytidylyltransferase
VQTPQTFQFKYWKNVSSSRTTTDLFTYLNLQVTKRNLVIGSWNNFKITNKKDLENL